MVPPEKLGNHAFCLDWTHTLTSSGLRLLAAEGFTRKSPGEASEKEGWLATGLWAIFSNSLTAIYSWQLTHISIFPNILLEVALQWLEDWTKGTSKRYTRSFNLGISQKVLVDHIHFLF